MDYKRGTARNQTFLFPSTMDEIISDINPTRVIDAYVENLDMEKLGFKTPELRTGQPPYRNQLLLKIFLYGYLERIRSSRKLEKECKRNTEMMWLTEDLYPDFKTIANFRKNNKEGIKSVFKEFLHFCNSANLLSFEDIGIDGTKFRAQNNMNNIFKADTIDEVKKRIDEKIEEYIEELEKNDTSETEELKLKENSETQNIAKKLNKLLKYKNKVEVIKELFSENPELEIYFANDNDSRFQSDKGKVRAGYNPQTAVDNKNKLIISNEVTNKCNDLEQMSPMVEKIIDIKKDLKIENDTNAIMDAGYFNEKEIIGNIGKEGINIIVPDKKDAEEFNKKIFNKGETDKIPSKGFEAKDFKYDIEKDICICPEGKELHKTHKNAVKEQSGRLVYEFQCKECCGCEKREKCTKNVRGRSIKISANYVLMEEFKNKMKNEDSKKMISKRKEIVEHPFGTMKRNLGYDYFMQVGLEKVQSEFSFICFVYNFKRVINILGVKKFIEKLSELKNK